MVFSKKRILKEGITKGDKIDYPCEYLHITNIKQIVPISIRGSTIGTICSNLHISVSSVIPGITFTPDYQSRHTVWILPPARLRHSIISLKRSFSYKGYIRRASRLPHNLQP
ncbi:hypothetical protein ING2E5A_0920 [Petrimonas mucosa]|jgi:hypothetical protein|uniref:Uncharacterized protein n=1 Tax=Petrimonas mucosa TaxID=1642646 RepID=A0A1G4G5D8_9BACT|nr:hypothetical protein ING2E5A_0920 [Petrimonas mucosa]